jgi:Flp pilus assembly protein TadG
MGAAPDQRRPRSPPPKRPRRLLGGDERGQVSVLVLGLALVVLAVAGVAVDGTRAFLARLTLQNAADSAALAGAGELDEGALYSSGGRSVVLDPLRARRVAEAWLTRRGVPARAVVVIDEDSVVIALRSSVATTFLGLVGISTIPVAAEATARAVAGNAFGTPIG